MSTLDHPAGVSGVPRKPRKDDKLNKVFAGAMLSLTMLTAHAERADSLKQTEVKAAKVHAGRVSGESVATGDVVIARGTLRITADNAVVSRTSEGYIVLTLTGEPDKLATFRQKRDGGPDLWVEGQASRIEYDERTEVVKLFDKVVLKQLENGRLTNELDGQLVSYDSRTDVAAVPNDVSGQPKQGSGPRL
jgi:lipopolysaccharide export system protein LptA